MPVVSELFASCFPANSVLLASYFPADSALFAGEENPPGAQYCAPLFSATVVESGDTVTHARGGMRGVEVELGFVLGG